MKRYGSIVLFVVILISYAGCRSLNSRSVAGQGIVRVAVIGGMTMTGLWQEISQMFEKETSYSVELVATGQREELAETLREGKIDLLTMHSGDITTDLVADGYGTNMRPWARNELVIVGPSNDPAKIRGLNDGSKAFRQIEVQRANFVDFLDIGSREVCHKLWKTAGIRPRGDWFLKDESTDHIEILNFAAKNNAYVVVGRMPVLFGKMKMQGMEILVENDPAMRRPYIVMEANPERFPEANMRGAQCLSDFLLSNEVQNFLAKSASNRRGGLPLFYPVALRKEYSCSKCRSDVYEDKWRLVVMISTRRVKDYYQFNDADDYTYAIYDVLPSKR
ncbi:MAG TPA: substrate-binding domain-containing protein [Sedimentisphaerales bacterium]|nr:substrate-binding domain-containing protein [Sedimentisphaerales bacterium]